MAFTNPVTGDTIPNVGDPGTPYASEVTNTINHLCDITHTGPQNNDGYQLNQNALVFTGDLPMNDNNLISIRSCRFVNGSSVLSGINDVDCIYVDNGNLYYNNASGTPIQITTGGSVYPAVVSNVFVPKNINSNLTILPTDTYTLINVDTTSNPVVIQLPVASTVPAYRFYTIYDVGNNAATNNITVNVATGSGNLMNYAQSAGLSSLIMPDNGMSLLLYTDGVNTWYVNFYSQFTYQNETVTFASGSTLLMNGTLNFGLGGIITGTSFLEGVMTITTGGEIAATLPSSIVGVGAASIAGIVTGGIASTVVGGIQNAGGPTDYVSFSAARSRGITTPLIAANGVNTDWAASLPLSGFVTTVVSSNVGWFWLDVGALHEGATLTSIQVSFIVGSPHSAVPIMPSISAWRYTPVGNVTPTPDAMSSTNTQPFSPAPSTGAQWYNGGGVQFLTFFCNQNNIIQKDESVYYIGIIDETGGSAIAGNGYLCVKLNYTNIVDMRFQ